MTYREFFRAATRDEPYPYQRWLEEEQFSGVQPSPISAQDDVVTPSASRFRHIGVRGKESAMAVEVRRHIRTGSGPGGEAPEADRQVFGVRKARSHTLRYAAIRNQICGRVKHD